MEKRERKSLRLREYDYSQNGAYFVTICTAGKKKVLCSVGNAVPGVPPRIEPTAIGKIVLEAWDKLSKIDPYIKTDAFCLMPNHIHGIIMIEYPLDWDAERRGRRSLPNLIQGFKSAATRRYNLLVSPAERNKLWQGSYYDEIIRSEAHYLKAAQYILDNPGKWVSDEYYCA